METHSQSNQPDTNDPRKAATDGPYRWLCAACGEHSDWGYATQNAAAADGNDHAEHNPCGAIWSVVQSPDDVDWRWRTEDYPPQRTTTSPSQASTPSQASPQPQETTQADRVIDPNDPTAPLAEPGRFDIPDGVGYRLSGKNGVWALVGPTGRRLTPKTTDITVVTAGRAEITTDRTIDVVRWQPDLRELDAYDRRAENSSQPVGGYGPRGERRPPKETITHHEEG